MSGPDAQLNDLSGMVALNGTINWAIECRFGNIAIIDRPNEAEDSQQSPSLARIDGVTVNGIAPVACSRPFEAR
jgi:hypothetical protein